VKRGKMMFLLVLLKDTELGTFDWPQSWDLPSPPSLSFSLKA